MSEDEYVPRRGCELHGLAVLLIVIPATRPTRAHFYNGIAVCDGQSIGLRPFGRQLGVPPIAAPPNALCGLDLRLLERLIAPDHFEFVARFASGVEAAVTVFSDETPNGGLIIENAFFGLARGEQGEPLLLQDDRKT